MAFWKVKTNGMGKRKNARWGTRHEYKQAAKRARRAEDKKESRA